LGVTSSKASSSAEVSDWVSHDVESVVWLFINVLEEVSGHLMFHLVGLADKTVSMRLCPIAGVVVGCSSFEEISDLLRAYTRVLLLRRKQLSEAE
jgi:hypothetical protein